MTPDEAARARLALRYQRVSEHRERVIERLRGDCTPERRALLETKLRGLDADFDLLQHEERLATLRTQRRLISVSPPTGRMHSEGQ